MRNDDLAGRLALHAAGSPDAEEGGFADVLFAYSQEGGELHLDAVWDDLVGTFQQLQRLRAGWPSGAVPLNLAYPVAEILATATGRIPLEAKDAAGLKLTRFAWRVACAWEALLAGDIEDIQEHVRLESLARGI